MRNNYSIKYNDIELYDTYPNPSHIFDWKVSGVNCSTEDYSAGSVNDISLVFVTDIMPTKNQITGDYERVTVDGSTPIYFKVREVVKNAGQNRYTITCTSEYDELDQPLPNSYATPVANETAWQLFNRLQGFTVSSAPSSVPNGDYVINQNWYSKGMTYRQAYSYLAQLMGMDISSFLRTAGTSSDMSNRFPFEIDAQESNVLLFTPNNVKEIEIADYNVPTIKGVWVENNNPDIPYYQYGSNDPTESLILPYNPMISSDAFLSDLYDKVSSIQSYTPITLTTWTDAHYYQGAALNQQISTMVWWASRKQWIKYTENGVDYYSLIFNWELSPAGLKLQGTGNPQRQYDSGYTFEQEFNSKIEEINDNINNIFLCNNYPNANTYTYDVPAGMYLITTAQYGANDAASDGMWLARVSSNNYHYSTILAPSDGTSVSVSANQITVNRGSARITVCITRLGG